MDRALREVDAGCETMVRRVREWTGARLDEGRQVALLGGDHSTALGLIQAVAARTPAFGILQVDAHMDLREAFEGFEHSHASVMLHALRCPQVERLVQVAGRDFCQEEVSRVERSGGRIRIFDNRDLKREQLGGVSWKQLCVRIVDTLPEQVYLSFDIDGLDPSLCPHTGTPVPGGLSYAEAVCLIERVVDSGRRIVAFDLCEVAPGRTGEWDAAVAARLLFELTVLMTLSRQETRNVQRSKGLNVER
jgi:agmatinase